MSRKPSFANLRDRNVPAPAPVSYTHLTLPTTDVV